MAVFIPVCFMGGTSGTFYRQFGLTMAVAVGISLINAMTLCPALSALLMRPGAMINGSGSYVKRFHYAFDKSLITVVGQYKSGIVFLFRNRWIVAVLVLLSIGGLWWLMVLMAIFPWEWEPLADFFLAPWLCYSLYPFFLWYSSIFTRS